MEFEFKIVERIKGLVKDKVCMFKYFFFTGDKVHVSYLMVWKYRVYLSSLKEYFYAI